MKEQCRISEHLLYVIWNAWKERNRRTIARDDILQRDSAFAIYAPAILAEHD
jgi:hypothetical protein